MKLSRYVTQSLHCCLLPSDSHYFLEFWGTFLLRYRCKFLLSNRIKKPLFSWRWKSKNERKSPMCSLFWVGLEFFWLKHPDKFLTHRNNRQRFKLSRHFNGSWFLVFRIQVFFNCLFSNRCSAQRTSCLLIFSWVLMRMIGRKITNKAKNTFAT